MAADPTHEKERAAAANVAGGDAFIIAAARNAEVDYLAAFDRRHLIDPPEVSRESELIIGTPRDILGWIRKPPD